MTVTLTPEQEQRLARAARGRGLDSQALLHQALDHLLAQWETPEAPPALRVAGLHAGQYQISDDFDAPLPDGFWLGEE